MSTAQAARSTVDETLALLRWLSCTDVPAEVVLACGHARPLHVRGDRLGVVLDGCLAEASVGLPAQLLAMGVGRVLVAGCPVRPTEVADRTAAWARVLPDVRPAGTKAARGWRRGAVLALSQVPYPRRAVLGLPTHSALDLHLDEAARSVEALRLLRDSGRAVVSEGDGDVADESSAVGLSAVGCTACGVCVRACPSDALRLDHGADLSVLSRQRDACIGCLECVRLCPAEALSPLGSLALEDLVARPDEILAEVATRACVRCGARHPGTSEDLCAACRYRRDNPFGSRWPLAG